MNQFLRYLCVGLFNSLLGYAVIFSCMYVLLLDAVTSNLAGYGVGLAASFFLNKYFTFRAGSRSISEPLKFVLVFIVSYTANLFVLITLIDIFHVHKGFAQLPAGAIYIALSYALNKHFVFSKSQ
ncbi:GtrA family protein [Rhizobium cauense]|uniref:GtrA family protein n=1 Tax=Rhizobium cauense TaxID=1166683 RepID=UPI001C6E9949|nr:GtrA family protein [Rhizobium cauense]